MKNNRFAILISLVSLLFAASLSFSTAAFAQTQITTEISLPSSYVEYFDLKCPVDIDFSDDGFAVLENDERAPQNNRLIVNKNDEYVEYDFSAYDATEIRFFKDRVLFLSNSRIYIFDLETKTASDTGMVAATSFSVCGNTILTNTSSGLDVYAALDGVEPVFNRSFSVSLQYAPETVVLADESTAYYFYNKAIYAYDLKTRTGEYGTGFSGDARYSVCYDNTVYFSVSGGIYRFDDDYELSQINYTPSYDVQGIAINDGKLFACYKDAGAVNEVSIDASNPYVDNFTLFSITYDGDRINRISTDAKATEYVNGLIYTLDGRKIKYADLSEKDYKEYDLSPFIDAGSTVSEFATDGKTLLFIETLPGGDTKIHLLDLGETLTEIHSFVDYTSVTKVISYEGEYYFINNKTNVSRQYAEVNRLLLINGNYSSEVVFSPQGTGWDLFIDVFGEIYVSALSDGKNVLISSERDELFEAPLAIRYPFVDFDGNVYYVTDGNVVYRFDADDSAAEAYVPSLWANAPEGAAIADLVPAENGSFYILYNGFILKTVSDMNVATPGEIAVPEGFFISFDEEAESVKLKENGKLFIVSLSDVTGEYFDYLGYKTYSPEGDLIVVSEFSKYSLLADENGSYIARSADIKTRSAVQTTSVNKILYVTNDMNGYALPVIDAPYSVIRIEKNAAVGVVKEFSFNNVRYSLIKKGETKCYVPSAFLKPAVADVASYKTYVKSSVGQRGANIYSDSALTDRIGSLKYGDTVFVIEESDGVTTVLYGDGVAYISSKNLSSRTRYAIRNLLVILVLFVAILSSVFFILHTRVFKKKR